jgi:hypothetical protein
VIIGFRPQTTGDYELGRFLSGFPFVITTVGTNLVRLLHFMAIRALAERRLGQKIVSPPGAGAPLGMPSFRVRHDTTPCSARWRR